MSAVPSGSLSATSPRCTFPSQRIVANLVPFSQQACEAFSDVVDAVKTQKDKFKHQRKFLTWEAKKVRLDGILNEREAPAFGSDRSTTNSEDEGALRNGRPRVKKGDVPVWKGHYCICLDQWPLDPIKGWRLGKGKWNDNSSTDGGVDLMLGLESLPDLRRTHAEISFDQQCPLLQIRPLHKNSPISVEEVTLVHGIGDKALNKEKQILRFGRLTYLFEYEDYNNTPWQSAFEKAVMDFYKDALKVKDVPTKAMIMTPSESDLSIGSWVLHHTIGSGAGSVVSIASYSEQPSQIVAAKAMFRNTLGSRDYSELEIERAYKVRECTAATKGSEYLSTLKDTLWTNSAKYKWDFGHAFLLFTPLCRGHLCSRAIGIHADHSENTRHKIIAQVLMGVACLHRHNLIHRDIKPENIGIKSLDPLHVVLLDYGLTTSAAPGGLDERAGTRQFRAPEIEREAYSYPVDIWAVGIVSYEIMKGTHPYPESAKKHINIWSSSISSANELAKYEKFHERLQEDLCNHGSTTIWALIAEMLEINAQLRISAEEALRHESIQQIVNRHN